MLKRPRIPGGRTRSPLLSWPLLLALCGFLAQAPPVLAQADSPPVVTAPATAMFRILQSNALVVSATDPDGDAIASLTASPLPGTSTFTTDAANTSGTFAWTPGFNDEGSYTITFTASNALSGSASTSLLVGAWDRAPVVTGPFSVSGVVGTLIQFDVYAADPDGDAIVSFTMSGLPSIGPTFVPDPGNMHGVFQWTPTAADVGTWTATFTACNALCGSMSTVITVGPAEGTLPVVTAPATVSGAEGTLIEFQVTASDASGGHVALYAIGLPVGATFTDHGDNTGTFSWVPGGNQAGSYTVQFKGVNDLGLASFATTAITVADTNGFPVAEAGGPYHGYAGVPLTLDGSGSYDPDGDALTYEWAFGDGTTGVGAVVQHTYAACGNYTATLTVRDPGGLSDTDPASVILCATCPASILLKNSETTIRLGSQKPYWCPLFEVDPACFPLDQLALATFKMTYDNNPGVTIVAVKQKSATTSDYDGDGIPEIEICFSKDDLRLLFATQPPGQYDLTVRITATGPLGGTAVGETQVHVQPCCNQLAATITPNPLHGAGTLTFATPAPGAVRVRLFDLNGRLVRTLVEEASAPAGLRSVPIDARDSAGRSLPAAVYFYRIEAGGEIASGRLMILPR